MRVAYQFVDKPDNLALLRQRLAQIGLSEEPGADLAVDPTHPPRIQYSCPWLDEMVELQWRFAWRPGQYGSGWNWMPLTSCLGMLFRAASTSGSSSAATKGGLKLERPLADEIVERIAVCCANLTGKGLIRRAKNEA